MAPKYPRQRLQSVSIETYFPGSFDFMTCFSEIQAANAKEFPNLYVPHAADGQPLALNPYHLRNAGSTRAILIAINQCTFAAYGESYPGFQAFRAEAEQVFKTTFSRCSIERFSRVTYRYRNRLRVHGAEPDKPLGLHRILNFPSAEWFNGQGLLELDLRWSQLWERGLLSFEMTSERRTEFSFEIGAAVNSVPFEGLWEAVESAHHKAYKTFEDMITEDYRAEISATEED